MRCIVCEQPNVLKMTETAAPSLTNGEALVHIRRIGICGTDLHAFQGNQPFFTYPRVLGHELAGVIEQVGENAFGLHKGDQVAIVPYLECGDCIACRKGKTNCCTDLKVLGVHVDGGMREVLSVPVDHLIKTEGLTLDQSVILEPLSIGAHAVRRSDVLPGEFALVIGAGPIGLGVMAFAKQKGAKVIAMDINEERLQFCKQWAKADFTINALERPEQALSELTNGDLPTVVFDATGNAKSMMNSFYYVAHGGKLIFVGLVKADLTFSDPELHKRETTLMSSRNATLMDFAQVMQAIESGWIDADRYITHRADFDQMIDQYAGWTRPETKVIKAVVEL